MPKPPPKASDFGQGHPLAHKRVGDPSSSQLAGLDYLNTATGVICGTIPRRVFGVRRGTAVSVFVPGEQVVTSPAFADAWVFKSLSTGQELLVKAPVTPEGSDSSFLNTESGVLVAHVSSSRRSPADTLVWVPGERLVDVDGEWELVAL